MPTAQARPRALRPWRKAAPIPYPASARARPKRTPAAATRSISASAISVLARARQCSPGTPASAQRSGSLVHSSGRNNLSPSGTGTSSWARVSETRTWQFACLPRAPQYWRATPTERWPFLGKAVSSITSTALGPPTRASAFPARTARKGASSQAGLAMKCCSWSCPPSPRRLASGCRLLRPSGPSRPCRYKGAQRRRVLRPITSKNGASQVSRAASISDDPGSTTPHLLGRCDPRGDGAAHYPLKCPGSVSAHPRKHRPISRSCKASGEELDRGEVDHGCGRGEGCLEILGQPSVAAEPSEGPLDQPALGQDGKAAGAGLALDDLEPQTLLCCGTGSGLPLIAAIGEDQAEPGEAPAQPAADQRQPIAILDVGGVDDDHQQQAQGVDQNVALAAVDLLAGVIASGAAGFGGPHALAVDDASGRRGLPAGLLARRHDQLGVQYLPGSVLPPAPEIAEHRALGRQLLGQEVPGAAGAQQIEDGVQDLAQIHLPWPPEPARCR